MAAGGSINASTLAVRPGTHADSLAFAQVYETLVSVDCRGKLTPRLAERWQGDTTGRSWTLFLRPDAAFHDGTAVTARHLGDAWRARRNAAGAERDPRLLAVEGITVESERVLTVHLRDPQRQGPHLLADWYYAVHGWNRDSSATLGSALYEHPREREAVGGGGVTMRLVPHDPGSDAPVVELRAVSAGDHRDLLDAGVDVLLTRDRRAIEYATTRPELHVRQLPRDRAYVLVSTARHPMGHAPAPRTAPFPGLAAPGPFAFADDSRWHPLRRALARDVLRMAGDQNTERWWIAEAKAIGCAVDESTQPDEPPQPHRPALSRNPPRLVYAADDPFAAAIAARLVALGMDTASSAADARAVRELLSELVPGAGEPVSAVGLSRTDVTSGLLFGADLAYLIALPRHALDPCAAWRAFVARAPWVAPSQIAFIAETGPTLVTTARAPRLSIDWSNTLRILERSDRSGMRP